MDRAAEDDAEEDPEKARVEAELRGEHGSDQRARAGDGGEVMAEEDDTCSCGWKFCPSSRRARWRDARVVEAEHARCDEGRIIPVRDRQNRQRPEHPPCGVHHGLLAHVGSRIRTFCPACTRVRGAPPPRAPHAISFLDHSRVRGSAT